MLPNGEKIFERIYTENNLICHDQLGFKSGDLCINQLLSITHEICRSFDDGVNVCGAFLEISKAFDKVWYKGLLSELKQNSISGILLNTELL